MMKNRRKWLVFLLVLTLIVTNMGSVSFATLGEEAQNEKVLVDKGESAETDSKYVKTEEGTASKSSKVAPQTKIQGDTGKDTLTVNLGDPVNGFQDVDALGNVTTWPITVERKQIQVKANFSEQNMDKTRRITVNIPKGYKVLEYTAKTGVDIANVTELAISNETDAQIKSSALTALDGTDWNDQKISGYTKEVSAAEADVKTYSGKVVYEFNSNCDNIILTLTLGLQQNIMSHAKNTTTLENLTANMISGDQELSTHLSTTVSGLAVTGFLFDGSPKVAEGDAETGEVKTFETILRPESYMEIYQNHLADKVKYTVTYPDGVNFEGFFGGFTYKSPKVTTFPYEDAHLKISNDTANRQVTIEYKNVTVSHWSGGASNIKLYWNSQVDGSKIEWNKTYGIDHQMETQYGDETHTESRTYQVSFQQEGFTITVNNPNYLRVDLNGNDDFPYDYFLGGMSIKNNGPSIAKNLKLKATFDDNLQVRAIRGPVATQSGSVRLSNVTAETNKRTITKAGPYTHYITAENLGLAEDEYLKEIIFSIDEFNQGTGLAMYTDSWGFSYYGKYKYGLGGQTNVAIYNEDGEKLVEGTSVSNPGGNNVGAGFVTTTMKKQDDSTGSMYPGDSVTYTSTYRTADAIVAQNEVVDPEIIISLPEGVNLDESKGITATSLAGNNENNTFPLSLKKMETRIIDGVEWRVYTYKARNKHDMIANAFNARSGSTCKDRNITVSFNANVSSACPTYAAIKAQDVVLWDLGKTATSATTATDYTVSDTQNKAGKGTSYKLVGGVTADSTTTAVVQKPGLNVTLGIRTEGTGSFSTYDGTNASIAAVTPEVSAEVKVGYENTSDSAYKAGSEIYMPIPKKGEMFSKYFNNKEITDPINTDKTVANQWTGNLSSEITLQGFQTRYGVGVSNTVEEGDQNSSWVPIDVTNPAKGTWYNSKAALEAAGKSLSDVNMVKFVATADIVAGQKAEAIFKVGVDNTAQVGGINFWRTYQKGWRDTSGQGTWTYGSLLAAEPSKAGVSGVIFNDANANGVYDKASGSESYGNGDKKITGILTEDSGGIIPLNLEMRSDGTFASIDKDGRQYFLKAGDYTLEITNTDADKGFTTVTSSSQSNGTDWYMNIKQSDINASHSMAKYSFKVEAGGSISTEYVGIGLKSSSTITYIPGQGGAFTQASESLRYEMSPSVAAVPIETPITGYQFNGWTLNKDIKASEDITAGGNTYAEGTVIPSGTMLTRGQLLKIKVTENVVATGNFAKMKYTISSTVKNSIGGSITPISEVVEYGDSRNVVATPATGYEIESLKVNGVDVSAAAGSKTAYTHTLASIGENKVVEVTYKLSAFKVSFNLDGGSVGGNSAVADITVTFDAVIKSHGNFPVDPVKSGYTFRGWQLGNESFLKATDKMPASDVALKAIYEKTDVEGGSANIGMSAKNLYLSVDEAKTLTGARAEILSEVKAWLKSDPNVAVAIDSSKTDISNVEDVAGDYDVTFTTEEKSGERGTITVKAIVRDNGGTGGLGEAKIFANDFTYSIINVDGSLSADLTNEDVKRMSKVVALDMNGNQVDMAEINLSSQDLAKINDKKNGHETGNVKVTLNGPNGTEVEITITLTTVDFKAIFDLDGGTIDGNSVYGDLDVPFGSIIKSHKDFPKNPVKEGHIFKGWKTADESYLKSTDKMPAAKLALKAVYEETDSPDAGNAEIGISAKDFVLSIEEAEALTEQEAIEASYVKAWLKADPSAAVAIDVSKTDISKVEAKEGDYPVTFTTDDVNGENVSITVNAKVRGNVSPGIGEAKIGANDFGYLIINSDGSKSNDLTADKVKELSQVKAIDKDGNRVDLADITVIGLEEVNKAKNEGKTGKYKVTLEGKDGAQIEIVITLETLSFKVTFDTKGGNPATISEIEIEFDKEILSHADFPQNPAKDGYTFKGWSVETKARSLNTGDTLKSDHKMPAVNIHLTAKWEKAPEGGGSSIPREAGGTTKITSNVGTSDAENISMLILLMVLSIAGAGIALKRRKTNK